VRSSLGYWLFRIGLWFRERSRNDYIVASMLAVIVLGLGAFSFWRIGKDFVKTGPIVNAVADALVNSPGMGLTEVDVSDIVLAPGALRVDRRVLREQENMQCDDAGAIDALPKYQCLFRMARTNYAYLAARAVLVFRVETGDEAKRDKVFAQVWAHGQ
jgi:hypothetical protein